ncbi:dTMP kinase [Salinisphaera sp. Q1T1-3]|uniref:dTMP kinase n=1 Tax=Salinisphaera sp. Q1T1-3 TaxID=2321229 RepID=UPI000E75862E|nr:dTMP kinase [Salinisphaera sp. Q1T1-3]RJS95096.1 dTMP kinase [Salinisphaera sp. Q1T1-3]
MTEQARSSGRLITLEGGEGAGKSTQIARLAARLEADGHRVRTTREPGGTQLGEAVRAVLMADHGLPMPAMSELLLVFAARAAHLAEVIEPALAAGEIVICDRFTDASFAYQGAARGLGHGPVETLEALVQGERRPDGVVLLDLPVTEGMARAEARGKGNRFDEEARDFHEVVRQCYLDRAAAAPARYAVIDAAAEVDTVAERIASAVQTWL